MSPLCVGAGAFGIADPTPEAPALAARQGIAHFTDASALLREARPDGVIVATPNALHAPLAHACIEHGVPVLVEKPIADKVGAARALADAAERAGIALLVGHDRRHNPIIERAREIVRGGGIGRLTAVVGLWLRQTPAEYSPLPGGRTEGALAVPRLERWRYPGAAGWTPRLARERIEVAAADPLVRQLRHFGAGRCRRRRDRPDRPSREVTPAEPDYSGKKRPPAWGKGE